MTRKMMDTLHREITRIVVLVALGVFSILISPLLADTLQIPALSPWGLFFGGLLMIGALSHLMRRVLFPALDLQLIAKSAIAQQNIAAAIIFLGVCIVLSALIVTSGSILHM